MKLVVLIALVALAGCSPAERPRPQAASVTPPAGWRTPLPGTAPIAADWWQGFGDPELTRVVQAALANNPDIAKPTPSFPTNNKSQYETDVETDVPHVA